MTTVVHIPGGMGSTLVDARGRAIWGRVSSWLAPPSRRLALPDGGALRPGHVVARVRPIPRVWEVSVYHRWLRRLDQAGHRWVGFPYDWRRPIEETAERLEHFLPAIGGDVALVTHSQGGLAVLRALQRGRVTSRVRCAILVGLPMPGSFWAFRCMYQGLQPVRMGASITAATMRTFPAAWEQVPPTAMMLDAATGEIRAVYLHEEGPWYPWAAPLDVVRRAHEALRAPLPRSVPVHVISSTGFPTPSGFVLRRGQVRFPSVRLCRRRRWPLYSEGDASVPPLEEGLHPTGMIVHREHALHRYAFNDAGVQDRLLTLLSEHMD